MLNAYLGCCLIVAYNIGTAWLQARIIKANKPINHTLWAVLYVLFCWAVMWWAHNEFMAPFCLLIRKPLFDVALNLFRGLPFFYVSLNPKSIIDDIHFSLYGVRSELYLPVYFVAALISLLMI